MNVDGLALLEFGRVRALLADLATSYLGRKRLETLQPCRTRDEATTMLERVAALRRRADAGEPLPPPETGDLGRILARLARGGAALAPDEFLALGTLLTAVRRVREALAVFREETPSLWELGEPLAPQPHLESRLEEVFDPSGEIRDRASSDLRRIRREREQLRERLRTRLERLAAKHSTADQPSLVTLREGRYVLSVAQGQKGQLRGLVQDRSASGATLYVEPMEAVEENNALREKDAEEREEIRRILAELTAAFAAVRDGLERDWELLGEIDALRARERLGRRWDATATVFTDEREVEIRGARHPLLLEARGVARDAAAAREAVVPLDVELDGSTRLLLVTGPNMGGKTVALKCVGLVSVLAQSGCLVPASVCRLPWFDGWVVDVGDEQSLEQDLSTFAAHLKRWGEALAAAGPDTFVLLDELGSGTDPVEGAALAQSVLERLVERGSLGIVTSHLGTLKGFAASTEGLENASMSYDVDGRGPGYTLQVGVPGESRALDMARRLGFPPERVARAEALLPEEERDVRRLLADLREEKAEVARRRHEAEEAAAAARRAEREAAERLERILEERSALRAKAARQAKDLLRRAEREAKELRKAERSSEREATEARSRAARHRERLTRLESPRPVRVGGTVPETVAPGDRLWATGLAREVSVVRAADDAGRVLVAAGPLKVELPLDSLRVPGAGVPAAEAKPVGKSVPRGAAVSAPSTEEVATEVHLLGMRVDEALDALDLALDRALLAGIRVLRVVHGIGTGALQSAVDRHCRTHAAVRSHRPGGPGEGGAGVTVVTVED